MEWVGEPTRRDPTRYQMHLISIPMFVSACVSDCIGRESWAFGCFENTSLEMLSQERRGEGGSSAFAAKYQIHIHFTNNSSKIKTRLKFPIWSLRRRGEEKATADGHKFESWNQILQAPTHQSHPVIRFFWQIWEPWQRKWLTVCPFLSRQNW